MPTWLTHSATWWDSCETNRSYRSAVDRWSFHFDGYLRISAISNFHPTKLRRSGMIFGMLIRLIDKNMAMMKFWM